MTVQLQAESKLSKTCFAKAMTQLAMNRCASQEFVRVEAEMKSQLAALIQAAGSDPEVIAKISQSQELWLAFRDAQMEARFPLNPKQYHYGSIYPTDFAEYKTSLTTDRVKQLRKMRQDY